MKKALLLLVTFCALETNAQNYNIQFAGTGASSSISSVKVDNLTTGATLTLNGNDILHLVGTTGINEIGSGQSPELKVFPNPSVGSSRLQIHPPSPGNAVITLFDITGKQAAQVQSYLENSAQEFQLSGLNNGLYLVSVKGRTYHYTGKILSNNNIYGNIVSIERISGSQAVNANQKINDDKGSLTTVDMPYITGDRLKFTGISDIYSTVITGVPVESETITFNFIACTDGDGNNYPILKIGDQIWMEENLKTTKYRNGDLIGTTSPYNKNISGETDPKYQWAYDGNESNVVTYGRLYTWYAVIDIRNVCPTDWHAPTNAEWTTLQNYLIANGYNYDGTTIGNKTAKSLASTSGWASYTATGTVGNTDYPAFRNKTGFTALPGGQRTDGGTFSGIGYNGTWWSATEHDATYTYFRTLTHFNSNLYSNTNGAKKYGFSVRCLKDN